MDFDEIVVLTIIFGIIAGLLTLIGGTILSDISQTPLEDCMEDCYSTQKQLEHDCKIRCIDVIPELADKFIEFYKEIPELAQCRAN